MTLGSAAVYDHRPAAAAGGRGTIGARPGAAQPVMNTAAHSHPGYTSRKIGKFRTDKFET